jgi:hypothetical protein
MTSADHNSMPAEKLEWVTPKISLLEAGASRGKQNTNIEFSDGSGNKSIYYGPS